MLEYYRACMQITSLGDGGLDERLRSVDVPVLTCCDPDEGGVAEASVAWQLSAIPTSTRLELPPSGVGHFQEVVPQMNMDRKLAALLAAAGP